MESHGKYHWIPWQVPCNSMGSPVGKGVSDGKSLGKSKGKPAIPWEVLWDVHWEWAIPSEMGNPMGSLHPTYYTLNVR